MLCTAGKCTPPQYRAAIGTGSWHSVALPGLPGPALETATNLICKLAFRGSHSIFKEFSVNKKQEKE
jgi:hypothetical protein